MSKSQQRRLKIQMKLSERMRKRGHVPFLNLAEGFADEVEQLEAENAKLKRCVSFFKSVIQSGEPWTDTCQREYDALAEVSDETE